MLNLPRYREIRIYRPPPPPPPDWLPLQVRSALAAMFCFVSVLLIAALTLAPEPESDRIRKLWQEWGCAPPPIGRDVTVMHGQLRFLVHDPPSNRLVFEIGTSPPELWDADTGRVAVLHEQVDGVGQALFSPDRKQLLTIGRRLGTFHEADKPPPKIRVWDLQSGRFKEAISIPLPNKMLVRDCRLRWLDDRDVLCVVRFFPGIRHPDHVDDRGWAGQFDTMKRTWSRFDADESDVVLSGNSRSEDNVVARQWAGIVSAQFGNCYVWSANNETRILIDRNTERR